MIAATVALAALILLHLWGFRAALRVLASIGEAVDAAGRAVDAEWVAAVEGHLTRLDDMVDRLPAKWAEMEEKVRASEDRTRGRIRRAVASIESGDDGGYDRLAREVERAGLADGEGSEPERVQAVPNPVATPHTFDPEDDATLILLANARKFGG